MAAFRATLGALVFSTLLASVGWADNPVILTPAADNWISSCSTGCVANNGGTVEVRVRSSWWGSPAEPKNFRSLLLFDLSSLPTQPACIIDARLGLYCWDRPHTDPVGRTYEIRRLVNGWDEMESTWQARDDFESDQLWWDSYLAGEPAYKPGGADFAANVYASAQVPANLNEWMVWDVAPLIQDWVSGTYINDGLIVLDSDEIESDPGGGTISYLARFRSREYSNPDFWPYLEVELAEAGDLNCDGSINNFDIDPFTLALTGAPEFSAYYAAYPDCDPMLADINDDGSVNNFDIDPFVGLLSE